MTNLSAPPHQLTAVYISWGCRERNMGSKAQDLFAMLRGNNSDSTDYDKDFTNPITPHDRVIVVEGQNFYVYSGHLSFCSEYFRTMFESNFKEQNQEEIEIEELAAEDFHLFLQALVPGNTSVITVDNYQVVLACARRFLSHEVLSMCEQFIIDQFDNLDKIEMLSMAFEYNWTELKERVVEFLIPTSNNSCPSECHAGTYIDYFSGQLICNACDTLCDDENNRKTPIDKSSFMVQNQEKLLALPAEIRAFLFDTLLKKA